MMNDDNTGAYNYFTMLIKQIQTRMSLEEYSRDKDLIAFLGELRGAMRTLIDSKRLCERRVDELEKEISEIKKSNKEYFKEKRK